MSLIALLGVAAALFSVFREGSQAYSQVLEKSNPSVLNRPDTEYRARQLKEGVKRQFWYTKGGKNLQACLSGNLAEMVFEKKKGEQEIVELMQGVACWFQEDVYTVKEGLGDFQLIRYLEADRAQYHYGTEKLEGEGVKMTLYEAPGKELAYDMTRFVPLMQGEAGYVTLDKGSLLDLSGQVSLRNKTAAIRAERALIDLKGDGKVTAEQQVKVDLSGRLQGSCERAEYYPDGRIFLYGDVRADSAEFGAFRAEKEVQLCRSPEGNIETLKCLGPCRLVCDSDGSSRDIELLCFGELLLDRNRETVFIASPQSEDGSVAEDKQAFFRDHQGRVFADRAEVLYQTEAGKTTPRQVVLNGRVRMYNRQGAALQYALADRAIFDAASRRMRLIANRGKRVLFFDKMNNLQVSAPELWMTRDETTGKSKVQGKGDVRFEFRENELAQIRTLMNLKAKQAQ